MFIPRKYIDDLFILLNENSINYILIKNINNELPEKLINGKDIDILVHPGSKQQFENIMLENKYYKHTHPLGIKNGWYFSYGLQEYQFWKKADINYDLFIDTSFTLCCKSLIPKIWIPLDKKINDAIWEKKYFNEKNLNWQIDDQNLIVYLIVRCIFDKQHFSTNYISEIQEYNSLLSDNYVNEALRLIFFKFTPRLIELIQNNKFDLIFHEYITFLEY